MQNPPRPKKSIAVILSGKSRSGGGVEEQVREELGSSAVFITTTSNLPQFQAAMDKAKHLGVDQIWVGGGDGSVRLAAKEMMGGEIPLGILPLGTGNSLARELGIPLRLAEAIELYMGEPDRLQIDVGEFDQEAFVNVATIGLTTEIAKELQTLKKGFWGRLAYVPAMLRTLRHCTPFSIEVETPEGNLKAKVFQFVAASGRLHGGPFPVTESASIVDGRLSLYAVKYDGPLTVFRYLKAIAVGRHTELANVWNLEATNAKVTLRRQRYFVIDGDRIRRKSVTLGLAAGALTVLVPVGKPSDERI